MTTQNDRYAVIGTGKTGGTVSRLLGDKAHPFDEYHRPTPEKLRECDCAIIFVPGSAAAETVEVVLEAGIPAVWGTTGYDWPAELPERVSQHGGRWVIGSNFRLGMNLVRQVIQMLGREYDMLPAQVFLMTVIHTIHIHDAPSGTALSWQIGRASC